MISRAAWISRAARGERTVVDHGGEVTTVVENHVGLAAVGEGGERLLNAPEVLLLGLALPGEDRDAAVEEHSRQTRSMVTATDCRRT